MHATEIIIIGGGQAGLAMSRYLTDRGVDHVILERGRVAERWRSERWDSLRLLTPRWQSRLPGWRYRGPDPDGFMTKSEVVDVPRRIRALLPAPLHTGVTVTRVARSGDSFGCRPMRGGGNPRTWSSPPATAPGPRCPHSPPTLAGDIDQLVPTQYRNPQQLRGRRGAGGGRLRHRDSARLRDRPDRSPGDPGGRQAHSHAAPLSGPRHHGVARRDGRARRRQRTRYRILRRRADSRRCS